MGRPVSCAGTSGATKVPWNPRRHATSSDANRGAVPYQDFRWSARGPCGVCVSLQRIAIGPWDGTLVGRYAREHLEQERFAVAVATRFAEPPRSPAPTTVALLEGGRLRGDVVVIRCRGDNDGAGSSSPWIRHWRLELRWVSPCAAEPADGGA